MKILSQYMTIFALILTIAPAIASEASECEIWKAKADYYMSLRQQGMPIISAVKKVGGNRSRGLLLRAYAVLVVEGSDAKAEAILAFSNEIDDECKTGDN